MIWGRSFPIKAHYGTGRVVLSNYKISGVVTLSGSPQAGAVVYLIDDTTGLLVGSQTTDGSGAYIFSGLDQLHKYHAAVEYDDGGGNKYNSKSLPYLTPYTL